MPNTELVACIPTRSSALYETFGVDVCEVIDPELMDMSPVEWIELGEFPDQVTTEGLREVDERVPGYRFDWSTLSHVTSEYSTVTVERVDQVGQA